MSNIYKDLKVASLVVLAICIVLILMQVVIYDNVSWAMVKEQVIYNTYYGFPMTFGMSWFFDYVNRWISWDENPKLRTIVGILGSIALTMIILFILNFILWVLIKGEPVDVIFLQSQRIFYLIGFVITMIVTSVMHTIGFFNEVQTQKEISYKLKQQKLSSELNALRAHVDPHFLFNSFNVLSGLIDEDTDRAQSFLSGLSGIYRYILEQRNESTSTLTEELGFAKRYLDLQRMRFENGIKLETDIDSEKLQQKIPSLTLQMLLENAIKHNAFDASDPLVISLSVVNDHLVVKNNTKPRKELVASNGIGLQNIRDRYQLLSGNAIDVINGQNEFIVKLPLL